MISRPSLNSISEGSTEYKLNCDCDYDENDDDDNNDDDDLQAFPKLNI